jgi:hypothetical protein
MGPLILGLVLLIMSTFTTRQLQKTLASELTGRAIAEMDTGFASYLRPVEEIVDLSLRLGRTGEFEFTSTDELDLMLGTFLDAVSQVSSIHVAKSTGEGYMLLRKPDGDFFSRTVTPEDPGWATHREWLGMPGEDRKPAEVRLESEYKILERAWFTEALSALESAPTNSVKDLLNWTDPYVFSITNEPGITASVAYKTPSGNTEILAFNILLSDILKFTEKEDAESLGVVFALFRHPDGDDLEVLAVSREELSQSSDGKYPLYPIPISQLTGVSEALVKRVFGAGYPNSGQTIRFDAEESVWWGAATRSPLFGDKEIWIASAYPQSELLAGIPDTTWMVIWGVLLTVVIMVLRARLLARRYGEPIGELVAQTERISRLNFVRDVRIESPIQEVQQLASSQDSMRRSLASISSMNDRDAIARELRSVPSSMRHVSAGRWEIELVDEPTPTVGGSFSAIFPARVSNAGTWSLPNAEGSTSGAVIVLATTQLCGMPAAQHAAAVRAAVRAHLHRSIDPGCLIESVRLELVEGAGSTAPLSVGCIYVDGSSHAADFVFYQDTAVLHWKNDEAVGEWTGLDDSGSAYQVRKKRINLDQGDTLVMVSAQMFDILNADRQRLSPSFFEDYLAACSTESAKSLAGGLSQAVREFSASDPLEMDVSFVVVSRPQAP